MLWEPRELLAREELNPPELPKALPPPDDILRLPARSPPLGRLLDGLVLALGDRGLLERFEAERSEGRFADERSVGRLADDRSAGLVDGRSDGRFDGRSVGRFVCRLPPPNLSDVLLLE
jgi:hypothetical protein